MSADKVIEIARRELGYTEYPPGSNRTKGSMSSTVSLVTIADYYGSSDADNLLGLSPFGCI